MNAQSLNFEQRYNLILANSIKEQEAELETLLNENQFFTLFHVSHQLKRFGLRNHQKYDTEKYNGFTIGLLEEDNQEPKLYFAICSKTDQYSRKEGRSVLLDRMIKDYKKNTISYITVNTTQALQDVEKYAVLTHKQKQRIYVNWFIKTHINKPSKNVLESNTNITKERIKELETSILSVLSYKLNNLPLRLVYNYQTKDTTKVSIVLKNKHPEFNEREINALEHVFNKLKTQVIKNPKDVDNRIIAKFYVLKNLASKLLTI